MTYDLLSCTAVVMPRTLHLLCPRLMAFRPAGTPSIVTHIRALLADAFSLFASMVNVCIDVAQLSHHEVQQPEIQESQAAKPDNITPYLLQRLSNTLVDHLFS